MKLDEILDIARFIVGRANRRHDVATDLAQGLIDLLGEDQPCGFEEPAIFYLEGQPHIAIDADSLAISDVRLYCAMLIRAAEKAGKE